MVRHVPGTSQQIHLVDLPRSWEDGGSTPVDSCFAVSSSVQDAHLLSLVRFCRGGDFRSVVVQQKKTLIRMSTLLSEHLAFHPHDLEDLTQWTDGHQPC